MNADQTPARHHANQATTIADQVVPEYRNGEGKACTSHTAKRWQAAWDGACIALGGDPSDYRKAIA